MRDRLWYIVILVIVIFCSKTASFGWNLRLPGSRGFLLYRTNSISQRPCTCSTTVSCSCCETVTLIYSKERKTLCSNFMYQRNGLNVDISLGTDTIKSTTVSVYRPFKFCSAIPGSIFSSICINITELNQFPRSLTVCVRHEIVSKTQEWQIDYTCVSISTELPTVGNNMMAGMMMTTSAMTMGMTMKPLSSMTMATGAPPMMMSTAAPPMTMSTTAPPMTMSTAAPPMMMTSAPPMMMTTAPPMMMTTAPPMTMTTAAPLMMKPVTASSAGSGGMSPSPSPGGQMGSMRPGRPSGGQMAPMPSASSGSGTGPSIGIEPARKRRYAPTRISSMSSGSHSGDRASSMTFASAPNGASEMSRSMDIEGKRQYALKRKFNQILINNRHDRRASIVNDKIEIPNINCKDKKTAKNDDPMVHSNRPVISNLPVNMTTFTATNGFPPPPEIVLQSNEGPVALDAKVLHDRTQYFPSRIPPGVANSLENKSIANPYIFSSDESSRKISPNNGMDVIIFPD